MKYTLNSTLEPKRRFLSWPKSLCFAYWIQFGNGAGTKVLAKLYGDSDCRPRLLLLGGIMLVGYKNPYLFKQK